MSDSPTPERRPPPEQLLPDEGLATPEFLASLLADGDDDMAAWVIGEALAGRTRAEVYDGLVRPAMELVGARWLEGQWSISVEHLATVALNQALSRVRPNETPGVHVGPTAVLAAPEEEQHIAGLACLAQVLEDDGWVVENLGANVPADDLVRFLSTRDVDLVALSIGTAGRLESLRRSVDLIRAADGRVAELPLVVGGNGLAGVAEIAGASFLCHSLADAQRFARSLSRRPGNADRR